MSAANIVEGSRFDDLVMSEQEEEVFDTIEELRNDIEDMIARVKDDVPSSRERSLAITKLQEAMFWLDYAPLS